MQLDPKHLLILAEIHDCGGFSEAALSLNTSQPSLSRVIKNMEERLGEPLFARTRKPLRLTPIGQRLADQGRAIRTATNRASESVALIRSGEEGELRIGGTPFFLEGFISGLIAEFQAFTPNVTIHLTHAYTDELIAQLLGGRLDIALCPVTSLNPEWDLQFTPLIRGHNVVACRVGHPLRAKRDLSAQDLVDYPWVAPPARSPLNADLKDTLASIATDRIKVVAYGGGLGSVVNYLIHSDCLTVLPHTVVFALGRKGSLAALPLSLEHQRRSLGMLTPRANVVPALVESMSRHLSSQIASLLEEIRHHEMSIMQAERESASAS